MGFWICAALLFLPLCSALRRRGRGGSGGGRSFLAAMAFWICAASIWKPRPLRPRWRASQVDNSGLVFYSWVCYYVAAAAAAAGNVAVAGKVNVGMQVKCRRSPVQMLTAVAIA